MQLAWKYCISYGTEQMSLKAFFDSFDDSCEPHRNASFSWSAKGCGFGQMTFYIDEADGYVHCANEIMSRAFLKDMLCKMVDNCVLDDPNERHPDTGPDGKPPGYNPKPIVKNDKDIPQG